MASQSGQPGDAAAGNDSDGEFDPSADMLVNDYDDEHTLEEEEANADMDNEEEIDDLQREGEMPLEELLAMYGYGAPPGAKARERPSSSSGAEVTSSSQPATSSSCQPSSSQSDGEELVHEPDSEVSAGSSHDYWSRMPSSSGRLFESDGDEDDEEDDEDYDEDDVALEEAQWRRQIQIGPEHQADVPESLSEYGTVTPAYEEEDVVLWDPKKLPDQQLDQYLAAVEVGNPKIESCGDQGENGLLKPKSVNSALQVLHQCEYKVEDAIRRHESPDCKIIAGGPVVLDEEEMEKFETGLRSYGKDFHAIHNDQLPGRSVRELVQYYYSWKKSDRFKLFLDSLDDIHATKFRTDKRKLRHTSNSGFGENVSEDNDLVSGSGVESFINYTTDAHTTSQSHSIIPFNFGQGIRSSSTHPLPPQDQDGVSGISMNTSFPIVVPNGLTKQVGSKPVSGISFGIDDILMTKQPVQSRNDGLSSSESTTMTTNTTTTTSTTATALTTTASSSDSSLAPNLNVNSGADSSIDCK